MKVEVSILPTFYPGWVEAEWRSECLSILPSILEGWRQYGGGSFHLSYLLSWRGGGSMEVGVSIFLGSGLERGQTLVLTTLSSLTEKERSTRAAIKKIRILYV